MTPFTELPNDKKLLEVIRWLCVWPAAMLGEFVVQFFVGGLIRLAEFGGWNVRSGGSVSFWLGVFLFYLPRKSAFVAAGALMAPRYRVGTAVGLSILGIEMSLLIHVVGQHLAGNRVGLVNYAHFTAETVGILAGAAYIIWRYSRQTRMAGPEKFTAG